MIADIKNQIALKIGLTELNKAGTNIIRDKSRYRINERDIEYFWILNFNHQNGFEDYYLFTIKLNESSFREFQNSEEIITGIFNYDNDKIDLFYYEISTSNFEDKIAAKFNELDFFISKDLNGKEFPSFIELLIETKSISADIKCEYLENKKWADWNNEIMKFGKSISERSKNSKLQEIIYVY